MKLKSMAFKDGEKIPQRHACGGPDLSPDLSLADVPAGAKTLAMIMDDPDAPMGTFVHWVVWNIPAEKAGWPEGASGLGVDGTNSFRKSGYSGPCPPPGKPHRYFFKAYALDCTLELKPGSGKAALEAAMEGHILAKAELMGTYSR